MPQPCSVEESMSSPSLLVPWKSPCENLVRCRKSPNSPHIGDNLYRQCDNSNMRAVSRGQLRVRSGGGARIGYAALGIEINLAVDPSLPSAVLSTHSPR